MHIQKCDNQCYFNDSQKKEQFHTKQIPNDEFVQQNKKTKKKTSLAGKLANFILGKIENKQTQQNTNEVVQVGDNNIVDEPKKELEVDISPTIVANTSPIQIEDEASSTTIEEPDSVHIDEPTSVSIEEGTEQNPVSSETKEEDVIADNTEKPEINIEKSKEKENSIREKVKTNYRNVDFIQIYKDQEISEEFKKEIFTTSILKHIEDEKLKDSIIKRLDGQNLLVLSRLAELRKECLQLNDIEYGLYNVEKLGEYSDEDFKQISHAVSVDTYELYTIDKFLPIPKKVKEGIQEHVDNVKPQDIYQDSKLSDEDKREIFLRKIIRHEHNYQKQCITVDKYLRCNLLTLERLAELEEIDIASPQNNNRLSPKNLAELEELSEEQFKKAVDFRTNYKITDLNNVIETISDDTLLARRQNLLNIGLKDKSFTLINKETTSEEYDRLLTLLNSGFNGDTIYSSYKELSNEEFKELIEFSHLGFSTYYKVKEILKEDKETIEKAKILASFNVPATDLSKAKLNGSEFEKEVEKLKAISSQLHFFDRDLPATNKPEFTKEEIEGIKASLEKAGVNIPPDKENDIDELSSRWKWKYISGADPLSNEQSQKLIPYALNRFTENIEEHEPRTRWLYFNEIEELKGMKHQIDLDDFIANFPDIGETYSPNRVQSFAKHPYGAETYRGNNFSDSNKDKNVKFVVYPKYNTSNCYDTGEGKYGADEVLYLPDQKFRVLYKGTEHVEGHDLYTIYMQEE